MIQLSRALAVSRKDVESYYGKPPLVTWGLLFPSVLILGLYLKDPSTYEAVAPGVIAMTLLFGNTSMAAIVITFEKRSGTFERLLLAPITLRTILVGKAASAAGYGLATSLVLALGLRVLLGLRVVQVPAFAFGLLAGAATFALLGLVGAVVVREVFEAMTLMNFFRFPLLFVSGVFVPVAVMPAWAKAPAMVSPLTHVVELLRFGVTGRCFFASAWVPAAAAAAWLAAAWVLAERAFRAKALR